MLLEKIFVVSRNTAYAALVFDFDGTLVDSLPAHLKAWQVTMLDYGVDMTVEDFYPYRGISPWEICSTLAEKYQLDIDIEEVTRQKARRYLDYLDMVTVHDPILEIVRDHHGVIPMAVATGNYGWVAEQTLVAKHMLHYFDVVISSKEVKLDKPAPDVFLEAAQRMGVPPTKCCAFEDTDIGEQAARSAGMDVVRIQTLLTAA